MWSCLRTLTSLEYSIIAVYEALADIDGLDEDVAYLLTRFIDDHAGAAVAFADLTTAAGGEPYECPNAWLMSRTLQPVIDHIVGATVDGVEIPPSDDPSRDALATADALETLEAATAQHLRRASRRPGPACRGDRSRRRGEPAIGDRRAARHATTRGVRLAGPLVGEEPDTDDEGLPPHFAISARFGQLTPVPLQVGVVDEAGQRFTINLETPAENSYVYEGETCPA